MDYFDILEERIQILFHQWTGYLSWGSVWIRITNRSHPSRKGERSSCLIDSIAKFVIYSSHQLLSIPSAYLEYRLSIYREVI